MSTSRPQVLIVEDNSVLADVMRFNLERAGMEVTLAVSAEIAISHLRQSPFSLMISDYQLPGISGEQLCVQIRQELQLKEMPIFVCTAKGFEIDIASLQSELGVRQVIFKPFSMRETARLVCEAVHPEPVGSTR